MGRANDRQFSAQLPKVAGSLHGEAKPGNEESVERDIAGASASRTAPAWQGRATAACVLLFAAAAPWSIAAAQSAVVLLAVLLLVTTVAAWARCRRAPWREETFRLPPTLVLVLVFLLVQALSIPLGIHPAHSLRCFRGSWVMLFAFVFTIALSDGVRGRALRWFVASAALAGLYGGIQHFTGLALPGKRLELLGGGFIAVGTLGHHLSYAGVLLPAFFVALGLFVDARAAAFPRKTASPPETQRGVAFNRPAFFGAPLLGPRRSWLWAAAMLLILLGVVMSYARTAWVGMMAGLLLLGIVRGRRTLLLIVAGMVALGIAAVLLEPQLLARVGSIAHHLSARDESQDSARVRLWLTSLRMAADHPWIGAGLGSFGTLFERYRIPGAYMSIAHPHSDPLNVLVETGAVGLAAWTAIWIAFFGALACVCRRARGEGSALPAALSAAVAALLVGGLGQCFSTDEKVAQVWWFVTAAGLREAEAWRQRSSETPRSAKERPWAFARH